MNTSLTAPKKFGSYVQLSKLQTALRDARSDVREVKREQQSAGKMLEQSVATGMGAALMGGLSARGWSDGSIGAVAGATLAAGIFMGQPTLVHVANGILAPLVAGFAAEAFARGSSAGSSASNVHKLRSAQEG